MYNETGGLVNSTVIWPMNLSAREIYGVIVAPLIIPLFGAASGGFGVEGAWSLLGMLSTVFFSYAGMIALGLPAIAVLKRRGKLTLGWLLVAGTVGGAIIWLVILALLGSLLGSSAAVSPFTVIAGAVLGAFVALTYGLIAGVRVSGQAI